MAFFPSDDGLVEGVHSIDVMHSIVTASAQEPVFAGSVQMEITVRLISQFQILPWSPKPQVFPHSSSLDRMAHVMHPQDINTYDAGIVAADPITGDYLLEGEELPIQEGTRSMVRRPARLAAIGRCPPPPPPLCAVPPASYQANTEVELRRFGY